MSLLGPFWCQRDRAWVRFNIDQGKASAEIFQPEKDNLTWQPVQQGSWPISYVHDEEEVTEIFFSLEHGVLYSTEGKFSRWEPEVFQACQYQEDGWVNYNVSAGKKLGLEPFADYVKDSKPLTPYHELPLTPEMVKQKRLLEEERIRLATEEEQQKWETYKKRDLRAPFLKKASQNTLFAQNPGALDILLNTLNKVLLDYPPSRFNSCDEYLLFLKTVIEDDKHQLHKEIINTASQTDLDRDLALAGDEILRRTMIEHKKTVFFNLLRKEMVYLCQEFNKECTLTEEEPVPVYLEPIPVQRQPQPEQSSPSFFLALINLFNFFINHQNPLDRQNQDLAAALEASRLEAMQQVRQVSDLDLSDLTLLQRIQLAVSNAQTRYKEWFDDESGAKEIRGRDGFFSRYRFRHSASGQERATVFKDDICTDDISEQEAILQVNSLLQHSNTAYNRHSFASFLLDELKLINNGPWSAITANSESNLYDRATVLTVLEAYVYPEIPEPTSF